MESLNHSLSGICQELRAREMGKGLSPSFFRRILTENISKDNFLESQLNGIHTHMKAFTLSNHLCATLSYDGSLKIWNLVKGVCFKEYQFDPKIWFEKLRITGNSLLLSGRTTDPAYRSPVNIVQKINLISSQSFSIMSDQIDPDNCYFIDPLTYCMTENGCLTAWDQKGRLVQSIETGNEHNASSIFLANDLYVVHIHKNRIFIYNHETGTVAHQITTHGTVSTASLAEGRLFCGFDSDEERHHPDFCYVELDTGQVLDPFEFKKTVDSCAIPFGQQRVKRIAAHEDWVFLIYYTGDLVAAHLGNKSYFLWDSQPHSMHEVLFYENLLITTTVQSSSEGIKVWNLYTHSLLKEIKTDKLVKAAFANGKLTYITANGILERQYYKMGRERTACLKKGDCQAPPRLFNDDCFVL